MKTWTLEEIPHVLQHENVTDVAFVRKQYACSINYAVDCGDVEVEQPPRIGVTVHRSISLLYPGLNDSLHR